MTTVANKYYMLHTILTQSDADSFSRAIDHGVQHKAHHYIDLNAFLPSFVIRRRYLLSCLM